MSAIQNYLNKAQEFSQQVSQEEQLEQSKTEIRQKAESNIEDVRQRVEELKAGIAGDVGAFGFGAAGAIEKGFQYGKYVSEKAAKLREGVNALREKTGFDDTSIGKSINEKLSNLISPDSALGRHLQTVGDQVNKLKAITEKSPVKKTQQIMDDIKSRFDNLTPKGQDDFVDTLNEKKLIDPLRDERNITGNLESAIQHNEVMKQVEGVPENVRPGLLGGGEPGAPLSDIEETERGITEGQATTQDFTQALRPAQELGGAKKVRIRAPEESGGGRAAPLEEGEEATAADPRSLLKPGESLLADLEDKSSIPTGSLGSVDNPLLPGQAPLPPARAAPEDDRPPPARAAPQPDDPIQAPSVQGAPQAAPVETPSGGGGAAPKFQAQQEVQEQQNLQQEQVAGQKKQVAEQQEQKVEKDLPGGEGEGGDEEEKVLEKGTEEGVGEGVGEGILGALGPVGDVLAAGSAIYGLVHAEIAKRQEAKEQVDLQSYYDSLNQVKAPNLGSLGANVLDGTQMSSAFTNF